ncbi:MAG: gliding motility-associated ABC transporter permease subunit GldF [Bacteroidetes bacterium]|nr:MAG: gliding motility-associated ABC transporter permease subunit GldF [Bacteroidota bacterium]
MLSLLVKEINAFLNALIGYLVILVFLTSIGLFMWVFPGNFNILDSGYANIDTLFIIAPWVFMFLAPAITMRSFSEEKRTGTIELLLTKPLTDWQIVFSKFIAGFLLVIFSLLPTLVYFFSVYLLGNPPGNIDMGGTWGSYFGLLFLSGAFVAIGLFASSITDSQIISFILGVFLSFFCYVGFESVSGLALFRPVEDIILKLGINEHYISMSRGVIDTRDVVYFFSLIYLFLLFTKTSLSSRKW